MTYGAIIFAPLKSRKPENIWTLEDRLVGEVKSVTIIAKQLSSGLSGLSEIIQLQNL